MGTNGNIVKKFNGVEARLRDDIQQMSKGLQPHAHNQTTPCPKDVLPDEGSTARQEEPRDETHGDDETAIGLETFGHLDPDAMTGDVADGDDGDPTPPPHWGGLRQQQRKMKVRSPTCRLMTIMIERRFHT